MICTKCNNQVPDGAKFCPNCGTLTAKAEANKSFCENCGLELPKGAKFCAVCGAAVASKANVEIKPSDVLSPVTPSEPVSVSPAVVLDKKPAETPVTVSAVNINTESPFSIPIPASDVSMPAVGSDTDEQDSEPTIFDQIEFGYVPEAPVISESPVIEETPVMPETPVMSETPVMTETPAMTEPTGYSSAAASYSAPSATYTAEPAPAPSYTPAPSNQMENPFGDYGMGAAAVATKPIKKKNVLKPILIAVGSLIGAVLIAAGVLFFVNKSFLFNIVLGNSGYAGMVEGNSIKEVTDNIDFNAMSQGIKTSTNSYANALMQLSGRNSGITTTSVKPMMASSSIYGTSVDLKTLISQLGNMMREAYGANSANISIDLGAELTDTGLSQLAGAMNCSKKDIEEVLKLINDSNISVDVTADEKALESGLEFSNGSLKLNAKAVITEDGNAYLVLPFVSEKAIMVNVGSGYTASAGQVSDVCLEIEEKELKRIMEKLVSIYIDVYKSSEITVQNGEMSVAGAIAKGKYITAKLNGDKIIEMVTRIGEAFANDSYLCEKFAKFMSDCGMPASAEQFKSAFQSINANTIRSVFNMLNIPTGSFDLTIETVTDNNCRVLAKSYSVSVGGQSVKISVVGDLSFSTKTGNTAALAIEVNGQPIASALIEKSSDYDGVCTINIYVEKNTFTFKIKYNDVKKTTFRGKPAAEGTYEISFVLPTDFTQTGSSSEIYTALASAKIVMSVKVENENTVKETMSFEIPQYGKLSANATLTVEDKPNGVSIPSDVLDISAAAGANGNGIPESLKKDVISYLKDMKNAVRSQNAGKLGNQLVDALDKAIDLAENGPSADSGDISDLITAVENEKSDIMQFDEMYDIDNEELTLKSEELIKKYEALTSAISDKIFDMTQKEFDGFRNTLATLTAEKDALQKEYEEIAGPKLPSGTTGGSKADDIEFMTLPHEKVSLLFTEYSLRFDSVVKDNSTLIQTDSRIYALAKEASDAYEKAEEDCENFYDVYDIGSLNLSLLRKYRKSTQAFALAVEALEQAVAPVL